MIRAKATQLRSSSSGVLSHESLRLPRGLPSESISPTARSFIVPVPGGYAVLQPVALAGGRMAVTEVYVPAAAVSRGVAACSMIVTPVTTAWT